MTNFDAYIEKAKTLVEALPFIKRFYGKTVVIKYGGSALINEGVKISIMKDIALMKVVGMRPVVVHGGGPEINNQLQKIGKEAHFVNGLRVTDDETMEVVEMVLSGKINKQIVTELSMQGVKAVGISGRDGGLLKTEKIYEGGVDIGNVGSVTEVDTGLLYSLIDNDFIPVIAPIGSSQEGSAHNVNGDYAAVAIAGALKAEKLVFLTDVAGVLKDVKDPQSIMSFIEAGEINGLIEGGTIAGGMIPKIECCMKGVNAGVANVHILDGRVMHCLLLEIFTPEGIGTMIVGSTT